MKFLKFILIFILTFQTSIFAEKINHYKSSLDEKLWLEIINLPKDQRPVIGLVLGGGGVRGSAHIGVLQVFDEENIPIDLIVGTSAGAIIGAMYAAGKTPNEIEKMTEQMKWSDIFSFSFISLFKLFLKDKLLDTRKMRDLIADNIGNKDFYELNIPFACTATDIVTGERVVLRDGDVGTAVRASASLPGVFEPVEYRQRYLVDGGIVGNVPADVAKALGADIVIAVDIEADYTQNELKKVISILFQIAYIQGRRLNANILKNADIILNPDVSRINLADFKKHSLALLQGKKEARKKMDKIKEFIIKKTLESKKL